VNAYPGFDPNASRDRMRLVNEVWGLPPDAAGARPP
jgi:hypothetical protein